MSDSADVNETPAATMNMTGPANLSRTRWCRRCDRAHPLADFPMRNGKPRAFCRASEKPRGRPSTGKPARVVVRSGREIAAQGAACDACGHVGYKPPRLAMFGNSGASAMLCPTCWAAARASFANVARLHAVADCIERAMLAAGHVAPAEF